ncbi:MAG: hypothetical protein E7441_05025 [Ruminococcaceae bacterium]|nr:hypothetical protein [Oscillospiraceae bacterium]
MASIAKTANRFTRNNRNDYENHACCFYIFIVFYPSYPARMPPYRYSTLKQADAELQNAKNLASNEEFLRSVVPTLADIGLAMRGVPKEEFIPIVLETLSSTSPGISDLVEYGLPKLTEKNLINAQEYHNYLKNDEDQYLINFKPYREAFISNLNKELEKMKSTNSFGYSSDDENERFKTAVMEELLRILKSPVPTKRKH